MELPRKQEPYHWKEALSTGACLVGGVVLLGSVSDPEIAWLAVFGLLAIILALVAFNITNGWQHADDLTGEKKLLAYIPVILGGVVAFALIALLWLIGEGLKSLGDS